MSLIERFEAKIYYGLDGCWYWIASQNSQGYGRMSIKNKTTFAHRISYSLYNGDIKDKLDVLHKCDNPMCVNPNHLFLGTHQDNMTDMKNKDRNIIARGSNSNLAILNESQVLSIRKEMIDCEGIIGGIPRLAKKYNVSRYALYAIKNKKTWKHI